MLIDNWQPQKKVKGNMQIMQRHASQFQNYPMTPRKPLHQLLRINILMFKLVHIREDQKKKIIHQVKQILFLNLLVLTLQCFN